MAKVKKTISKAKGQEGKTAKEEEVEKAVEAKQEQPKQEQPKQTAAKEEAKKEDKQVASSEQPATEVKADEAAPTGQDLEKLTQEAIADIFKLLEKPCSGVAVNIPGNWHAKYKAALGPYKKFCMSHPEHFTVFDRSYGIYIVTKTGEKPPPVQPLAGAKWKDNLRHAWINYCIATPASQRSRQDFFSALPDPEQEQVRPAAAAPQPAAQPAAAASSKPEKAEKAQKAEKPAGKASPKAVPAPSPKAAPAASPKAGAEVKKDKLKKKKGAA